MRFATIYSDPDLRNGLLSALAASVRVANEANPAGWSASLRANKGYVNLTVGRIYVLSLQEREVWITVDESALSDELTAQINDKALTEHRDRVWNFKSVPDARGFSFDPRVALELWPSLREAHYSAIRKAAATTERTPVYRAFSDELLDFVEGELGENLPRPTYEEGGLTPERLEHLVSLVGRRYPGWSGFEDPRFVKDENDYKRKTADKAQELLAKPELEELIIDGAYDDVISRIEAIGKDTNLLFLSVPLSSDLAVLYQESLDKPGFCRAFVDLIHGEGDGPDRLERYLSWIEGTDIPRTANKWTFPTYFLFFMDPEHEIFVKPRATRTFLKLAGQEISLASIPTSETYADVRDAYLELRERLADHGARDMLDAQGFVWVAAGEAKKIKKVTGVVDLSDAFARFRDDAASRAVVAVRRARAEQIQHLLARAEGIDVSTFNRDVWVIESATLLGDRDITGRLFSMNDPLTEKEATDIENALESGDLALHGNYCWGSGTNVFGAMLQSKPAPGSALDKVVAVLADQAPLPPAEITVRAVSRALDPGSESAQEVVDKILTEHPEFFERHDDGRYSLLTKEDVQHGSILQGLEVLHNSQLSPPEKAEALKKISGFGPNASTGLVMLFHPAEFAIYNRQIRGSVERLGIDASTNEVFQEALSELKEELEADDYLELDWFLWQIDKGVIPVIGPAVEPTSFWWVNQGKSYEAELGGGFVWAGRKTKSGAVFQHHTNVSLLVPGQRVIHYAKGHIRAIGTVAGTYEERTKPGKESGRVGYYVPVEYEPIGDPIPLEEIPLSWRTDETGPFNRKGGVNQGYMYPLSRDFVTRLTSHFPALADIAPEVSPNIARTAWLFQANPKYWSLAERVKEVGPYTEEDWSVAQHADEMKPGDYLYLWQGGKEAGIYAVGELTDQPRERPVPEWKRPGSASETEMSVPFRYLRVLDEPIMKQTLRDDRELSNMHVIRMPRGTNFKVTPAEHARLQKLLSPFDEERPDFPAIQQAIQRAGMRIGMQVLRRYHLALNTRGFVILSGISGTGKTWLTQLYANALGARYRLVPVAPNWTSNEDLLGYYNPITNAYHDTPFGRFLREAADEYEEAEAAGRRAREYHLVLDEMNLARLEYYFARFLSAMEIRNREGQVDIDLGPGERVLLAPNLKFIGTINVDETSHGFSDKVYDRAQLVELEAPRDLLSAHVGDAAYGEVLMEVWDAVRTVAPFAFRVIDDVDVYVTLAEDLGVPWEEALDEQLVQKILPKFRGGDPRIGEALARLLEITAERFPLTNTKARAMNESLLQHGFTSYF